MVPKQGKIYNTSTDTMNKRWRELGKAKHGKPRIG